MNLSLKARILLGTVLWTAGLFICTVVGVHQVFPPPAAHWYLQSIRHYGPVMAVVALLLMLVGFLHVRGGTLPINRLRMKLAALHSGVNARVDGSYPAEVQPLVDDLNALLEERERRVKRAIAKAGDLAHGLKTPLAVLTHEAQQVRAKGHSELADEIDRQLELMQRQIDYHLVHARASDPMSPAAEWTSVADSAEGLVRALRRLHAERDLQIEIDAPPTHDFRGHRADLDEMLGNLLDNACKWARTRVHLISIGSPDKLQIAVEDDGPGIEPPMRSKVLQRGIRADEANGSGLGLAIVHDLAEIHGGSISLLESQLGGTKAVLELPGRC
jgi:signal transduction histidine kinase